jgi:hypothetical protein
VVMGSGTGPWLYSKIHNIRACGAHHSALGRRREWILNILDIYSGNLYHMTVGYGSGADVGRRLLQAGGISMYVTISWATPIGSGAA